MIRTIRPWQIFSKLGNDNEVVLHIPTLPGRETQSVMCLETELLIAVARIVKAQVILELGTSMGYTAMHLARNTTANVVTVDKERKPCIFDGTECAKYIARSDSDIFDFDTSIGFDMVFADINYTRETVARSTEIAFGCNPKVIAWHDYKCPSMPWVADHLDYLALEHDFIHVEDSSLLFWFKEPIV